ncbi:MAG: hypothetical protein QM755_23680 [Luteolibacter sp.]
MGDLNSTIGSNWRITYDLGGSSEMGPVDFGDDLVDEPQMSWSQSVDNAPYTGADSMDYFGRGLVQMPFRFSVLREHADDATMRTWICDHLSSLQVKEKKTLKVEINGGANAYQFPVAILRTVTPVPVTNGAGAETVTDYQFDCGRMMKL